LTTTEAYPMVSYMNDISNDGARHKKTRKVGSGRTKGSFSFVAVPLEEIMKKLGSDTSTPIVVGRKWAEQLGFSIKTTTDAKHITGSIEGTTPATQPKVVVQEL
jgi:hypothetical protein